MGVVPDVLAFTGVDLVFTNDRRFGGIFLAAGVKTAGLAFTFLETGTGETGTGWFGNLPPFLRANSSGWILGSTPPEAIVTPLSSYK